MIGSDSLVFIIFLFSAAVFFFSGKYVGMNSAKNVFQGARIEIFHNALKDEYEVFIVDKEKNSAHEGKLKRRGN